MQEINWPYSFAQVSQDKSTWRTSCQSPIWEIAGIDGSVTGALKPHPGMKEAWVFRYDQVSGSDFGGTNPYAAEPQYAVVKDFWPFTCRIGASALTYGVVYVVQRPKSTTLDLIIEGWRTDVNQFYQKAILVGKTAGSEIGVNRLISVSTTPRVIYLTIKGVAGYAITFPASTSPNPNIVASGPGKKPLGTWSSTLVTTSGLATPTTTQLPDPSDSNNPPGSFIVFSTATTTSPTDGWRDSSTNLTAASEQKAGDYAFAVQFEDSLSGRRSQLSDSVPVTFTGNNRKFTAVGVVDGAKYDTVKIWRSVRTTNAAGIFAAGILQLEAVFKAVDQPLQQNPASPSYGPSVLKWAYAVQKDDRVLVMQDTFQDKPSFMTSVPYGGASISYQSQLFVSSISGQEPDKEDQMRSVGEIRWSSASDGSYELFAPKARWTPEIHGDDPICFRQAGQVLLGFSKSKVFFIFRDGAIVRVSTAHNGYGVTSNYALETVGPLVYYMTRQGLRAVYPDGRLDEVGAIDWLVTNDWINELEQVSMAYDSRSASLYILNPVKKRAVVMWFSSGVCSEMHCFPFQKCARGYFPAKTDVADSAVFLHSPEMDADPNVVSFVPGGFRPRLMRIAESSIDRTYLPPGGVYEGVHYGLIDGPCDRNVMTSDVLPVTGTNYYEITWDSRGATGWTPTWRIIGSYCSIVSDGTIGIGKSTLRYLEIIGVKAGGSTHSILVKDAPKADSIVAEIISFDNASAVTINPVVLKVGTSIIPGALPTTGFITNKEVTSAGIIMSGVRLSNSVGAVQNPEKVFARWYAAAYQGDDELPFSVSTPINPNKQSNAISMIDGGAPIHAAFDKILDPYQSVTLVANAVGMDFRILAMNVRGRILETERNKNSYA